MRMTRYERLAATLRGKPVDRPPFNFYEINGVDEDVRSPDPYTIYSHVSWLPVIELARAHSDRILLRPARVTGGPPTPWGAASETTTEERDGSRYVTTQLTAGGRTLTSRARRDRDVNTVWTVEHLLKDIDDVKAWLSLPEPEPGGDAYADAVVEAEQELGDTGIVMIDTADPLCMAASLFDMGTYTVIAMTEPAVFHAMLERFNTLIAYRTQAVARALPGRLWRIFGPEYASPPYLPPRLFREYVVRYVRPMVESIQRAGGFARVHSHGNLRAILDDLAGMGIDGLDPIEPPPQGDVELRYVRENYGRNMVLFGNLEASDIENLPQPAFAEKVRRALDEGTAGEGRGFVLQPSACPYGRVLSDRARRNYETIVDIMCGF